jgi:Zn-dependent protease
MSDASSALAVRDAIMYLVALVLSICVHEFGHAYIADRLGDPLPRAQGRVTLNPLAHVDPLGTIAFPLLSFILSSVSSGAYFLGWGKPVQVSLSAQHMTRRFTVRTSNMIISLAGPMMNVLFALFLSALFLGTVRFGGSELLQFARPLRSIIAMNIGLACFNLIPCPPLDGGAVLRGLLPSGLQFISDTLDRYGYMIFFALLATRTLSRIMAPVALLSNWWLHTVDQLAFGGLH